MRNVTRAKASFANNTHKDSFADVSSDLRKVMTNIVANAVKW
jgi:hypothetical protein